MQRERLGQARRGRRAVVFGRGRSQEPRPVYVSETPAQHSECRLRLWNSDRLAGRTRLCSI